MYRLLSVTLLAAMLGFSGMASAQDFDDNASVTSPGGKKIINALHDGQVEPPPPGKETLTKEQIAAMKSGTGWGQVFKNLKSEGYYGADFKNLGQLISHFNRLERASHARGDNLQRTSKGQIRPDRPAKPTRIEKVERPSRPDRPNRPNRPGKP